ncbi:MAG: 2-dehydropantoate 2-reductase [Candidatus Latescibacterota bacterium]|jgi:2-dehydropantoate 2-reductase
MDIRLEILMHFAVIGSGNMGCVYGANLARIGEDVTMVDVWEDHVTAMRERGLQMSGLHGAFNAKVDATINPAEAQKADVAIITVNAYNTRDAAEAAKLLLKEDGFALTLQNGLGNIEVLIEVLGAEKVMAGLTFHSGDLKSPGQVTHTNKGPTYLGELDKSKTERLQAVYDRMLKAEVEPVLEADIMATIWGKFVHNCGLNAICAITDLRPGHIREVPELDDFQTLIIEEVLALVKAKGIEIPEKNPVQFIKEYSAIKFHRVSMKQHLDRGRMTEIDALNGYVVRESEKLGLKAPYNDALTKLMKGRHHIPVNQTEVGN